MSVLERILARKREEVEELRRAPGESELRARADDAGPTRGFSRALERGPEPRVIAEFKRASPSKGVIRADADAATVARAYAEAGAVALSVLTDADFFSGCLADLQAARSACELPVLRKDFTIDALQIHEARAAGADAVLLITSALDDALLLELMQTARDLSLDALVEVHTRDELERARAAGADLVGVNNRDLSTFETDVAVTRGLLPHAEGLCVVSESGLDDPSTLRSLQAEGAAAFLVGESLMRADDPGEALRKLRGSA